MKIIKTKKYKKAQQVYNPDLGVFEDLNEENYDFVDRKEESQKSEELPVLTPEDIGKRIPLVDDVEQDIEQEEIKPIEEDQENYPEFSSTFEAIKYAIDNTEKIRIFYICEGGTYIIRDVEPHGWFRAKTTGNMILVTWDNNVNWYRAFIISPNIQKYEWSGKKFNPRFTFRVERNRLLGRLRQRKDRRQK